MQGTRTDRHRCGRHVPLSRRSRRANTRSPTSSAGFGTVVREGVIVGLGFTATLNTELNVASLRRRSRSPGSRRSSTSRRRRRRPTSTRSGWRRCRTRAISGPCWPPPRPSSCRASTSAGSAAGTQTAYSAYDTKADQHRPDGRRHRQHRRHQRRRLLLRLRLHRRSVASTPAATPPRCRGRACGRSSSPSPAATPITARSTPTTRTKDVQSRNIPDSLTAICPGGRCGNLQPSDLNRMESYHDVNGDIGGYIKKDKLWWYFSVRDQNIQSLLPNFPVKPFETRLRNLTGKVTYALNTEQQAHRLRAGRPEAAAEPDGHLPRRAPSLARHESADSTWRQQYWGHTYKAGWDSVVSDRLFFEIRGGQFKYVWPNFRYTEDAGVSGHRQQPRPRRQPRRLVQYPGAQPGARLGQLLQGRLGRQPQLQDRRRVLPRDVHLHPRAEGKGTCPGDVLHILNNGVPAEVLLVPDAVRVGERAADQRLFLAGHLARPDTLHAQPRPSVRPVHGRSGPSRWARRSGRSIPGPAAVPRGRQSDHVELPSRRASASSTT